MQMLNKGQMEKQQEGQRVRDIKLKDLFWWGISLKHARSKKLRNKCSR